MPLASIFGSGFLVIVPILNGAVEKFSLFAMALVCAVAYGGGSVVRFNITAAEPLPEKDQASEGDQDITKRAGPAHGEASRRIPPAVPARKPLTH